MRREIIRRTVPMALAGILSAGAAGASAGERRLTWTGAAEGLTRLSVESSVGDVSIHGRPGATSVSVTVVLKPRRSGLPLIGSTEKGRREIEAARLDAERDGKELELEIAGVTDHDRHFEEQWEIIVPAHLAVEVESGVGDVTIDGVTGGAEVDNGVGDVEITRCGGEIEVDAGVGDVTIRLAPDEAGAIDVSSGVGDCEIRLPGNTVRGKGLGCEASWKGPGTTKVAAESGVGDVAVVLAR